MGVLSHRIRQKTEVGSGGSQVSQSQPAIIITQIREHSIICFKLHNNNNNNTNNSNNHDGDTNNGYVASGIWLRR